LFIIFLVPPPAKAVSALTRAPLTRSRGRVAPSAATPTHGRQQLHRGCQAPMGVPCAGGYRARGSPGRTAGSWPNLARGCPTLQAPRAGGPFCHRPPQTTGPPGPPAQTGYWAPQATGSLRPPAHTGYWSLQTTGPHRLVVPSGHQPP